MTTKEKLIETLKQDSGGDLDVKHALIGDKKYSTRELIHEVETETEIGLLLIDLIETLNYLNP